MPAKIGNCWYVVVINITVLYLYRNVRIVNTFEFDIRMRLFVRERCRLYRPCVVGVQCEALPSVKHDT